MRTKNHDVEDHHTRQVVRLALFAFVCMLPHCRGIARAADVNEQPAITVPYVVHEEVPAPRLVLMEVTLTGYCPCTKCTGKNGPWNKRTTRYGDLAIVCDGVAADPGVLVPRSRIYIPGIGWREVDDIGGDIKGHRLDVRFPDHESALRFGIHRKVIVGVLVA